MFPYVFDKALPDKIYRGVYDKFDPTVNGWILKNYSIFFNIKSHGYNDAATTQSVMWKLLDNNQPEFIAAGEYIKKELDLYYHKATGIRSNFKVDRYYSNGQTAIQQSEFHVDSYDPGYFTVVLFVDRFWDVRYGGEFICQSPDHKIHYTPYMANTAVVIPSTWYHKGTPPLTNTGKLRTTLALTYYDENAVDTGY